MSVHVIGKGQSPFFRVYIEPAIVGGLAVHTHILRENIFHRHNNILLNIKFRGHFKHWSCNHWLIGVSLCSWFDELDKLPIRSGHRPPPKIVKGPSACPQWICVAQLSVLIMLCTIISQENVWIAVKKWSIFHWTNIIFSNIQQSGTSAFQITLYIVVNQTETIFTLFI